MLRKSPFHAKHKTVTFHLGHDGELDLECIKKLLLELDPQADVKTSVILRAALAEYHLHLLKLRERKQQ